MLDKFEYKCSINVNIFYSRYIVLIQFLGCKDKAMAPVLRDLIQTSYFRAVVVTDVDSVECCGALKVTIL